MILVTGCAGFIGYQISEALLAQGNPVFGIDNLNHYYDVFLKKARLEKLLVHKNFTFLQTDISDKSNIESLFEPLASVTHIVHLAAQPGVRYSLIDPHAYISANVMGHLCILELARNLPALEHMIYASTSSVYGANKKIPFSIEDRTDHPISLYAATKKSCEIMSESYAQTHALPLTGLRYFTVYGPWGRPDMALFSFTRAILNNDPIPVFNHGNMRRNFTYIDDIVAGTLACLRKKPLVHRLYNLGNNKSDTLMNYISIIEKALGKKAEYRFEPLQKGDIEETVADISEATRDFGFVPLTDIDVGIPRFVAWYRSFYGV